MAGASSEMRVKVLEWLRSEAYDGKDVADRFIGTKKVRLKLSTGSTRLAVKSTPAHAEVPIPLKGGDNS